MPHIESSNDERVGKICIEPFCLFNFEYHGKGFKNEREPGGKSEGKMLITRTNTILLAEKHTRRNSFLQSHPHGSFNLRLFRDG